MRNQFRQPHIPRRVVGNRARTQEYLQPGWEYITDVTGNYLTDEAGRRLIAYFG